MRPFRTEGLPEKILRLSAARRPDAMSYLDDAGNWRTDPADRRSRISCEFWHRLLLQREPSRGRTFLDGLAALVSAVSAGLRPVTGQCPALQFHRAMTGLVEMEALRNCSSGAAEAWDYGRRQMLAHFKEEFLTASGTLARDLGSQEEVGEALERLRKDSFFTRLAGIISDEEAAGYLLGQALDLIGDPKTREETFGYIMEILDDVDRRESLARPALLLLNHDLVPVSSGIPFQAAHLLGKLSDPRTLSGLSVCLAGTGKEYTELRACLVYALGAASRLEAADALESVLRCPSAGEGGNSGELREALWGLGRIGTEAAPAIAKMAALSDHSDPELRCALAWALGRVSGSRPENYSSGCDPAAGALRRLVEDREMDVHQEAVLSLRAIGEGAHGRGPEVDYATIPYLLLKPSSNGLYEVSETLFDLLDQKPTVVMAVTGDSGTGKTYFCKSLLGGFGRLGRQHIKYLARDIPDHNDVFNRMLGLPFLKARVDPKFYISYPEEEADDPDSYFEKFWSGLGGTRLVMLDGWRDEAYFRHVLEVFYRRGCLDLLLTFHAGYSTRRLNLEEREGFMEHVRSCLTYVEDPGTFASFHREGRVFAYRLNNAHGHRLEGQESQEVFGRRKVTGWSAQLRPGQFLHGIGTIPASFLRLEWEKLPAAPAPVEVPRFRQTPAHRFSATFQRKLNGNIEESPNLLASVPLDCLRPRLLRHYTPGQLAMASEDGKVCLLCGFNDRLYGVQICQGPVTDLAVMGSEIYALGGSGRLFRICLAKRTTEIVETGCPEAEALASDGFRLLALACRDGSVRLWDTEINRMTKLEGWAGKTAALGVDLRGRVHRACRQGLLECWDVAAGIKYQATVGRMDISTAAVEPEGLFHLALASEGGLRIGRSEVGTEEIWLTAEIGGMRTAAVLEAYPDRRLFLGSVSCGEEGGRGTLRVIAPRDGRATVKELPGHGRATLGCLASGPRLLSCGVEAEGNSTIKIWGTEGYISGEKENLTLLEGAPSRPAIYQSIF